ARCPAGCPLFPYTPLFRSEPVGVAPGGRPPAQVMGQAGSSAGAPPVLARAHHGSVSKEHRAQIEDALKSGQLPAVVATSSLELGDRKSTRLNSSHVTTSYA